jgi:hypothetical protein
MHKKPVVLSFDNGMLMEFPTKVPIKIKAFVTTLKPILSEKTIEARMSITLSGMV